MLKKILAVVALAASLEAVSIPPVLARSATGPATSESAPWWDTNANAANSRANLQETVLTPSTVPQITYLRSVTAPPPNQNCPQGLKAPVLAGGDLYAVTGGTFSKYNAATGALIWRKKPDPSYATAYTAVAFSGNTVIVGGYFCESETSVSGSVFAYNATTGAHLWTNNDGTSGVDGAVISGAYVITQGTDGSGACEITVINLSTGTNAWANPSCDGQNYLPLVVDGNVITTDPNSDMVAYNLATGTQVWSDPADGSAWQPQAGDSPGLNGKHLFATSPSGTVEGVNPATGAVQYTLSGALANGVLAVDASRVYADCSGDNDLDLCAYNLGTGAQEWDATFQTSTLAAEAGGVLYLDDGTALSAATGHVIKNGLWTSLTGSPSAIAVGDGRIAVVTEPRVLDLYGLPGY